jgi:hypothetical protein
LAASAERPPRMIDEQALLQMDRRGLDDVFAAGVSGPIPDGRANGTALMLAGSSINAVIARVVNAVAWKGKTFYALHGVLTNRLTPFGLPGIVAVVYESASWFDGKPCVVLDYSKTSLVARFIRDEIRLVAPALYLGKVYVGRCPAFGFCLRFSK